MRQSMELCAQDIEAARALMRGMRMTVVLRARKPCIYAVLGGRERVIGCCTRGQSSVALLW